MKRRSNGTTLIELIIASGLIFLILFSATNLLIACFRHYREVDTAAQVHQLAVTSMTRMERALRDGSKSSFQVFTSPPGIVFGSPRQSDGSLSFDPDSLQPLWPKLVCFYLEPDGTRFRIVKKEEYLGTASDRPPTIGASSNTAHFQSNVTGGALLARGVEELTFTGTDTLEIKLRVTDVSDEGASTEALFSVEVVTKINFRN
jgi:hypothetical protein